MTEIEIKNLVEEKTGVDITQTNRKQEVIIAKRIYFYIGRMLYGISNARLSRAIKLHHSTCSIHYDRALKWIETRDTAFCAELNKVIGYELISGASYKKYVAEKTEDNSKDILELIKAIPEDKRDEAYERIEAMVKGYNMVHGKDKITIIQAYE